VTSSEASQAQAPAVSAAAAVQQPQDAEEGDMIRHALAQLAEGDR
jgi:hypothetical protein